MTLAAARTATILANHDATRNDLADLLNYLDGQLDDEGRDSQYVIEEAQVRLQGILKRMRWSAS